MSQMAGEAPALFPNDLILNFSAANTYIKELGSRLALLEEKSTPPPTTTTIDIPADVSDRLAALEKQVSDQTEQIESLEDEVTSLTEQLDQAAQAVQPDGTVSPAILTRLKECETAIRAVGDAFSVTPQSRPVSSLSNSTPAQLSDGDLPPRLDRRVGSAPVAALQTALPSSFRPSDPTHPTPHPSHSLIPHDMTERAMRFVKACGSSERQRAWERVKSLRRELKGHIDSAISQRLPGPAPDIDAIESDMLNQTPNPTQRMSHPMSAGSTMSCGSEVDVPLEDELVDAIDGLGQEIDQIRAEALTLQDVAQFVATVTVAERPRSASPVSYSTRQMSARSNRAGSAGYNRPPSGTNVVASRVNRLEFSLENQTDQLEQYGLDIERLENLLSTMQSDTATVHQLLTHYQMIEERLSSEQRAHLDRLEEQQEAFQDGIGIVGEDGVVTAEEFATFQSQVANQFNTIHDAFENIETLNATVMQVKSDTGQLTAHTAALQKVLRGKADRSSIDVDLGNIKSDVNALCTTVTKISNGSGSAGPPAGKAKVNVTVEKRLAHLEASKVARSDLERMLVNHVTKPEVAYKVDRSYVDNIIDQLSNQLGVSLNKLTADTEALRKDTLNTLSRDLAQKADKRSVAMIQRQIDEGIPQNDEMAAADLTVQQVIAPKRCLACGRMMPKLPKFTFTAPRALITHTPKPTPATLLHAAVLDAQNADLTAARALSPITTAPPGQGGPPPIRERRVRSEAKLRAPGGPGSGYVDTMKAGSPFQIRSLTRTERRDPPRERVTTPHMGHGTPSMPLPAPLPVPVPAPGLDSPSLSRQGSGNGGHSLKRKDSTLTPRGEVSVTIRPVSMRE